MRSLYPRIRENSHEPQKQQKKNLGGVTFKIRPKEGYHSLRMTVSPSLPLPPSPSLSFIFSLLMVRYDKVWCKESPSKRIRTFEARMQITSLSLSHMRLVS